MAERKITGVRAPLVEDERPSLNAVYIFSDFVTGEEVKEKAEQIESNVKSMGILVSSIEVNPTDPAFVLLKLNRDNLSFGEIVDVREAGMGERGFKGFRLTTETNLSQVFIPEI